MSSCHFETNAQRPGQARLLSVTSFRSRDFVLASVFVLEVMVDLQPYRFGRWHVPNREDNEDDQSSYEPLNLENHGIVSKQWQFWCHGLEVLIQRLS